MITKEQIVETLKNVIDPEIGINIADLGLVYTAEEIGRASCRERV